LSGAEALERDAIVDVREEADIETGADALVVAEEEEVFDFRKLGGVDGDDELVDAVAFEERCEIVPGVDGEVSADMNGTGLIAEESEQFKTVGTGLGDDRGDLSGAGSVTADEDSAGLSEAGGEGRSRGAERQAKQQECREGKEEEQAQDGATEVESEQELNEDDPDAGPEALHGGTCEDLEGREAGEAVVGAHPEGNDDESESGDEEESEFSRGLEVEEAGERENRADEVGGFEGGPDQKEVGEGEQGPRFAILAAKHG